MLYFILLVIFVALIVGPVVAGAKIDTASLETVIPLLKDYIQINGLDNNDTLNRNQTGTGCVTCSGGTATGSAAQTSTTGTNNRVRLF